jgi:hypothetical protein
MFRVLSKAYMNRKSGLYLSGVREAELIWYSIYLKHWVKSCFIYSTERLLSYNDIAFLVKSVFVPKVIIAYIMRYSLAEW